MSENQLSLRLIGDLPPSQEVAEKLGVSPTINRRRGESGTPAGRPQTEDVWAVELISRPRWTRSRPDDVALAQAIAQLRKMVPALVSLDQTRCRVQLYISSIRDEEQGGFELPAELIAVAADARMELVVSILIDWPDDGGEEADERD